MLGSFVAGDPHLLEAFRQPHDRNVGDSQRSHGIGRCRRLDRTAVDDNELRSVGETLGSPTLVVLVDRLVVNQSTEPPSDDLGHGCRVVATWALDREPAVVTGARNPVLEHDHGRHRVSACQVRDVETLDA